GEGLASGVGSRESGVGWEFRIPDSRLPVPQQAGLFEPLLEPLAQVLLRLLEKPGRDLLTSDLDQKRQCGGGLHLGQSFFESVSLSVCRSISFATSLFAGSGWDP